MSAIVSRVHPFERAGFGHAPYKCTGHTRMVFRAVPDAPAQPGTCCDYCGTGIMDVYFVKSEDGVTFKVGCDCVWKVFREFDGTIPPDFRQEVARVEAEKRDERRRIRHDRVMARVARVRTALDAAPALFANQPHPYEYHAKQGKTLRDYYEWVLAHGGDNGRISTCQIIEKADAALRAA